MNTLNGSISASEDGSDQCSFPLCPSEHTSNSKSKGSLAYVFLGRRSKHQTETKLQNITKKLLWSTMVATFVAALAVVTWLALILTVTNRLRIPTPANGLRSILQRYQPPSANSPAKSTWLKDFSADILPVPCHAHNDYEHRVPLYEGLAAGCSSTEADIWRGSLPNGDAELFVGHTFKSLSHSRTLKSLYLDPLKDILTRQQGDSFAFMNASAPIGIFSMSPSTAFVLLLDFKTSGHDTWPTVLAQLEDLRSQNWLTTWTATDGLVKRQLTIVATGNALFDLVIANKTRRDIFYDAPLTNLPGDTIYNANNSYYASTSLPDAIGKIHHMRLSADQKAQITGQVERAEELGLKSRYWDTPSWPVGWRNRAWQTLIELGADVLNVDDLQAAARWDWQMCVVAGVNICNS